MAEPVATMLSRMVKVKTERHEEHANKLLAEGWRLLSVDTVPVNEGVDSYVEVKYVLGFPGQDPLED